MTYPGSSILTFYTRTATNKYVNPAKNPINPAAHGLIVSTDAATATTPAINPLAKTIKLVTSLLK